MPRPRQHAIISLALAAGVVARSRRWRDALPILVAGVLVDLDHLVDLALQRPTGRNDLIVVPLHAWEWVLALLARRTRVSRGLAGGLAAHLATDQALNRAVRHPLFYWISVRLAYRFRAYEPLVHRAVFEQAAGWMHRHPGHWW